ncbi:hypothetical protein Hypma_004907 [Hypsizygus marmoreus]|uniref:Uncharacterized protein n=1 Tax=Hypsizygus marmoreus TaxID=39966 RepID=A0A369KE40_HYPMA|nr:hypothetical protein Hypma_004907 [Hypsizygus marmoreus]
MGPARYLTPVSRPSPLAPLRLGEHKRLQELRSALDQYNADGVPVTFDDVTGDWVQWQRPLRILVHSAMTEVAASGFQYIHEGYEPPLCPHREHLLAERYMILHLKKRFRANLRLDFFRAASHHCTFTVVVPPLKEPLFTQTPEEVLEQMTDLDHLSASYRSPSEAEVAELLQLQQLPTPSGSQSGSSPLRSSTSDLFINSRVSSAYYTPTKPPRPQPKKSLGQRSSFYDARVADARAEPEFSIAGRVLPSHVFGLYQANPLTHPAADLLETYHVLEPYNERVFPGCLNRTNENLNFLSTDIGQAIRELNSMLGIPRSTLDVLAMYATLCGACNCVFSIDGYHAHIDNGKCGNSTSPIPVHSRHIALDDVPELILRTFLQPPDEASVVEFLDQPIGAAFLEWNSKLGIPQDVWALISTAFVHCDVCRLCRSFNGDKAHRGPDGCCNDGDEKIAVLATGKGKGKGKGKEREGDAGTAGTGDADNGGSA